MDLRVKKILLLISDIIALYFTLWLTVMIGYWGEADIALYITHAEAFALVYMVWLIVLYVFDVYDLSVPVTSASFIRRWLIALAVLFVIGIGFFYVIPIEGITPKTNLVIHVALFGLLAFVTRLFMAGHGSKWRIGLSGLPTCDEEEIKRVIHGFKHHGYTCVEFAGEDLAKQIRANGLNVVVLPRRMFAQPNRIVQMYDALGTGVIFLDLPAAFEMFARKIPVGSIDENWFLQNIHFCTRTIYNSLKRFLDVCVATLVLLASSPFWILIALLIKAEDEGPVFYRQTRVGKHRILFSIIKFRTMRTDAETRGALWAAKQDSRVTRVGSFLRSTHLDELPQMINVLRGDISLVGPRPERPEFVKQLEREIPYYRVRHFVKPGFTGWAQIKFQYARSVLDSRKKFEYDLYYIKNRSLVLDLLIMLKTLQFVFRGE